ncbi:copia protein [Tanacetum coccineum]|uniref:Copia protein n=1 Tax=Tanacetum coccineum TaxID=301880 RepID=A0ABQ5H2X4_9ASTR
MDSQESQGWEYLFDIDDSDLQLSAPLSFTQTQEMDNVEEKTSRIRIPGPAGIFQTDRIQKLRNFKDDPTQEYIRKHNFDDVSEDDDFQSSPWVKALEFMNDREEIGGGCFGDIESYLKNGKLETIVTIITSCKPNVLGNMNVILKDPSGTMSGIIHYKVLSSEDGYAKDIKVGSALILRNVSVFCDKSKNHALNITIKNLIKIINKDTVVKDADGASSSKI